MDGLFFCVCLGENEPFSVGLALYSRCIKEEGRTIMDEENIVRRMIDGDMDAFGELMKRFDIKCVV